MRRIVLWLAVFAAPVVSYAIWRGVDVEYERAVREINAGVREEHEAVMEEARRWPDDWPPEPPEPPEPPATAPGGGGGGGVGAVIGPEILRSTSG